MKDDQTQGNTPVQKKAYESPALRREARMPLITAGSFELCLPTC